MLFLIGVPIKGGPGWPAHEWYANEKNTSAESLVEIFDLKIPNYKLYSSWVFKWVISSQESLENTRSTRMLGVHPIVPSKIELKRFQIPQAAWDGNLYQAMFHLM